MVFFENGQEIISSYDSSNNCDGAAFMAWLAARDQNSASTKQADRAEATKAARQQKADDIKVLGPVFAELAALLRSRRAEANRLAAKPAAPKRTTRRRRRIKGD